MTFPEKLQQAVQESGSSLVVGLDPKFGSLPDIIRMQVHSAPEAVRLFCREVITKTANYCCGYKLNLAFFEALGTQGLQVFNDVRRMVPRSKIVIADAKRGDIGTTAEQYERAFFGVFDCDAVTLNPLMGVETLRPFLKEESRAVFALVLTSNAGASDFLMRRFEDGTSLSDSIALKLAELQREPETAGTIGMVVGATHGKRLTGPAGLFPDAPLLIPGIGAQGGTPETLIEALKSCRNPALPVISRDIIYRFDPANRSWTSEVEGAAAAYKQAFKPLLSRF